MIWRIVSWKQSVYKIYWNGQRNTAFNCALWDKEEQQKLILEDVGSRIGGGGRRT